jgi:hypothetical protein
MGVKKGEARFDIRKPVYGVGINDSDYVTERKEKVNGKWKVLWKCPYYCRWRDMLARCYSEKYQERYPTYKGCTVIDEWLLFSNFKRWMEKQDWEGKDLDKDLLVEGNKVYSPETCVFVPQLVNSFLIDCGAIRGEYPIGVSWRKALSKLQAYCRNPFTKKLEHLGYFLDPDEAHEAWKKRKHELACQLADSEYVTDDRIKEVLRNKYN